MERALGGSNSMKLAGYRKRGPGLLTNPEMNYKNSSSRSIYLASSQHKCHFNREAFPDQPSVPHPPITFLLSS